MKPVRSCRCVQCKAAPKRHQVFRAAEKRFRRKGKEALRLLLKGAVEAEDASEIEGVYCGYAA